MCLFARRLPNTAWEEGLPDRGGAQAEFCTAP
jgi:hypothetical protein